MAEINWFGFTFTPPLGLRIRYRKTFVTLIDLKPHRRKDGTLTWLLRWRSDEGREGWSGMAGNSVSWDRPAAAP